MVVSQKYVALKTLVKSYTKKKLDGLTNEEAEVITRRRALRSARLKNIGAEFTHLLHCLRRLS